MVYKVSILINDPVLLARLSFFGLCCSLVRLYFKVTALLHFQGRGGSNMPVAITQVKKDASLARAIAKKYQSCLCKYRFKVRFLIQLSIAYGIVISTYT